MDIFHQKYPDAETPKASCLCDALPLLEDVEITGLQNFYFAHCICTLYIGIGAGLAGPVLAGPLLFKIKIKFNFCKKQAMNRSASVIFRLVRLIILLYNR